MIKLLLKYSSKFDITPPRSNCAYRRPTSTGATWNGSLLPITVKVNIKFGKDRLRRLGEPAPFWGEGLVRVMKGDSLLVSSAALVIWLLATLYVAVVCLAYPFDRLCSVLEFVVASLMWLSVRL